MKFLFFYLIGPLLNAAFAATVIEFFPDEATTIILIGCYAIGYVDGTIITPYAKQ